MGIIVWCIAGGPGRQASLREGSGGPRYDTFSSICISLLWCAWRACVLVCVIRPLEIFGSVQGLLRTRSRKVFPRPTLHQTILSSVCFLRVFAIFLPDFQGRPWSTVSHTTHQTSVPSLTPNSIRVDLGWGPTVSTACIP